MLELDEYEQNFAGHPIPDELLKLWEFEQGCGTAFFSEGFELIACDNAMLRTYSEDPAFLDRLVTIGQADGTGSTYAFWLPDATSRLDAAPVIVFGSEGGIHPVACDIRELLRILTFDVESMVEFDDVSYYKDPDDHEPSEKSDDYIAWLAETYGIQPTDNADEIVAIARAKWHQPFKKWARQFIDAY